MNARDAYAYAMPPQSGRYGAAMGRRSYGPADPDDTARWYARAVRLDSGGYEPGAGGNVTYWGVRSRGARLYVVTDGESFVRFVDARDRADAIRKVRGGAA